ncbi:hypothetical protein EG327_004842 [Venturia inaequalis]|uniref:Uncharacterized protein n=1 Tax=Venturia inaequalis TaxID=5025 RepID=A0A8H3VC81_VENIN|nr:hypothetical protein EG327_004842 [Venturia inaequalis]
MYLIRITLHLSFNNVKRYQCDYCRLNNDGLRSTIHPWSISKLAERLALQKDLPTQAEFILSTNPVDLYIGTPNELYLDIEQISKFSYSENQLHFTSDEEQLLFTHGGLTPEIEGQLIEISCRHEHLTPIEHETLRGLSRLSSNNGGRELVFWIRFSTDGSIYNIDRFARLLTNYGYPPSEACHKARVTQLYLGWNLRLCNNGIDNRPPIQEDQADASYIPA